MKSNQVFAVIAACALVVFAGGCKCMQGIPVQGERVVTAESGVSPDYHGVFVVEEFGTDVGESGELHFVSEEFTVYDLRLVDGEFQVIPVTNYGGIPRWSDLVAPSFPGQFRADAFSAPASLTPGGRDEGQVVFVLEKVRYSDGPQLCLSLRRDTGMSPVHCLTDHLEALERLVSAEELVHESKNGDVEPEEVGGDDGLGYFDYRAEDFEGGEAEDGEAEDGEAEDGEAEGLVAGDVDETVSEQDMESEERADRPAEGESDEGDKSSEPGDLESEKTTEDLESDSTENGDPVIYDEHLAEPRRWGMTATPSGDVALVVAELESTPNVLMILRLDVSDRFEVLELATLDLDELAKGRRIGANPIHLVAGDDGDFVAGLTWDDDESTIFSVGRQGIEEIHSFSGRFDRLFTAYETVGWFSEDAVYLLDPDGGQAQRRFPEFDGQPTVPLAHANEDSLAEGSKLGALYVEGDQLVWTTAETKQSDPGEARCRKAEAAQYFVEFCATPLDDTLGEAGEPTCIEH